jgi:AraC-like DNA-binding protein
MDLLSEALNAVRVTSAIFFNAEFSAPWGFASPPSSESVLRGGAEHLVMYHLVTEGEARARTADTGALSLAAGDVLIIPHGDPHTLFNGSPCALLDEAGLERLRSRDLSVVRYGGGGEATRFVCGFLGCERHAERMFLAGLPPMLKINIRGDAAGRWLEGSIRHLVCETASGRPGGKALLSKMADVLFVETLRRYMDELPPGETGWLAGARDPVVGGVLFLIHRRPCHSWTLAELAEEVGASRSVIDERFAHFLGESPMAYLAHWRLRLAAKLLTTTRKTVLQVAPEVGYESEAAFNRAFKREFGLPPARYRRAAAERDARASGRPAHRGLAPEREASERPGATVDKRLRSKGKIKRNQRLTHNITRGHARVRAPRDSCQ